MKETQDSHKNATLKKIKSYSVAYPFSRSIVRHPWAYLCLFTIILIAILPGLAKIQSKWSPRIWFDPDHPQIEKLNTFEKRFGSDQFVSIGLYHPDGIFNKERLEIINKITEDLWQVKDIIRVESLSNYNYIEALEDDIVIEPFIHEDTDLTPPNLVELKDQALADEQLPNFFISPDATYSLIYGYTRPSIQGEADFSLVIKGVRKMLKKYKGITSYIVGPAAATNSFKEVSSSDNKKLIPFSLLFIITLLFIQFRSFIGTLLPLALVGITIGVTFGLLGHFKIIFNSLLGAIPGVLLAIALADAIHILTSFFHFRRQGFHSKDSVTYSLAKNFQPTILTSISTGISFFSITNTELAPIRDLGILSGLGTAFAWLFTYIFFGAVLSILSSFLDRFPVKNFEFKDLFTKSASETPTSKNIISQKFSFFINQNRWMITLSFLAMTITSVIIAIQNEVNSDPMKYFHKSVKIRQSYDFAQTKIDGLRGLELVVDSGKKEGVKDPVFLRKLESYTNWLKKDKDITGVKSVLDIIKTMNRVFHGDDPKEFRIPSEQRAVAEQLFLYTMSLPQGMDLNNMFTLDNRYLRMKISWVLEKSKESAAKNIYVQQKAKELFNLDVESGGNAPIYLQMNTLVVKSFFSSIAMALCLVSFLLLLVFKDLRLALLSMLPNVVPLCFGGALMQLLSKPIDIGTSIVSTVCLGIAVDDTIHFISSYRQYRDQGRSPLEAIEETFNVTGKALASTTIILSVGFGSFALADFIPNRNFGMLCSLILLMALITDLIFLPAILLIFDSEKKYKEQNKSI